ncbi:hypothetical protein LCGC14_0772340 [marine sediment metagenome]|uniref:Uncharacterized protein n=1 Tax=marine sediment metagenome TaxID=412755 RepID=A0A0F9Q224_9ZZZZ
MSDKMRWRYGDTNPVWAAVDSETVIEIGDLLFQDEDDAKPASMIRDHLGPAEAIGATLTPQELQKSFASNFLGVAMQRSRNGDITTMRLATTGVFEFDCFGGTFELGDLIGVDYELPAEHPDVDGASETCRILSQQVTKVADSKFAIGRVAKRKASATTSVLIDIRSTVMTGGVEGSSRSGV